MPGPGLSEAICGWCLCQTVVGGTNPNLVGYANYSSVGNAAFVDDCGFAITDRHKRKTNVLLVVKEAIPRGTEIRVDYDGDDDERSFRAALLASGVALADLDSPTYKLAHWEYPTSLKR